jgi:cell division initiation protein
MPDTGELLNRRFEKASFGGYKAADVDGFMAELAASLRESGHEAAELKQKLAAAEKRLKDYESEQESLKSTLLNAQRLADRMLKEAHQKAEEIVNEARVKSENLIDCAQSEIEMRKGEAERIKDEVSDFKFAVMRLYKAQLELIRDIPAEAPERPAAQQVADDERPDSGNIDAPKPTDDLPDARPEQFVKNNAEAVKKAADQSFVQPQPGQLPAPEATVDLSSKSAGVKSTAIPEQGVKRPAGLPERLNSQRMDSQRTVMPEVIPAKETEPPLPVTEEALTDDASTIAMAEAAATGALPADEKLPGAGILPGAEVPAVKLNLRLNEKTGEYEPIGQASQPEGDGVKFGAGYDLFSDSFGDEPGRRATRRKN